MGDLIGFEIPKMDWSPGPDLYNRFKRFKQKCGLLFDGPLKSKSKEQRINYLLLWSGDHGLDLFNTWTDLTADEKKDIEEYWKRFEEHVKPQANHILSRFNLRNLRQNNRPLDVFLTEAQILVQSCGFPPELQDEMVRDTLVFGTDHETVKKKCIAEGNSLTLNKAREIARTEEATRQQLDVMKTASSEVDAIKSQRGKRPQRKQETHNKESASASSKYQASSKETMCDRCGNNNHESNRKCPASGVECHYCHKRGHFSKMCRKRQQVNEIHDETDTDDDECNELFLGTLQVDSVHSSNRNKVYTDIDVTIKPHHKKTTTIRCKVDTGAETNVISKSDFNKIVATPEEKSLGPPQNLIAYGGQKIQCAGTCELYVHYKGTTIKTPFTVTNVKGPAMLGCNTCEQLGLVTINCSIETDNKRTTQAAKPQENLPLTKERLVHEYKDCFEGLGTFKMTPYHITIDPEAEPTVHPPRTVPIHLREAFKAELDNMEELGVIEPVNEPTDWVNSVVLNETVNDKGEITKLRVCLDPRDLNKWVKREHYHTRTIDDVISELHGAKYFSVIDAKKGYWHVPLDKESSLLTTFNTPFGRYRFTRMPFGLNVSQDIFQKELDSSLEGLPGVTGIADDNFVYGRTEKEHDENVAKLMERARDKGVKFNKDKVQLKCKEVSFFGHTWTPGGVKPDSKKVSAILDMQPPRNVKDLQSFLGLVNYLTRYSGRLATITAPLSELTKANTAFVWSPEHDKAFKDVKDEIVTAPVLRYFDKNAETAIQTDASQKGLGAVLLQNGQPVCYASKALNDTESNYSNIERETLGVVWGLERFHYFIYGKHCTVQTDHKPLESIFKKKLTSCPPRLQRLVLRALKYDVTVTYVKGVNVPIADALSRITPQNGPTVGELPRIDVHCVTKTLPASPTKLQQIREETERDPTLSLLKETIFKGWPNQRSECPTPLHDYWNFREELTIEDGILLKQDRIIVPPKLRVDILASIHQGHLGIEKSLLRARSCVYWPAITRDITQFVEHCNACQKHQKKNKKEPILQPDTPSRPWETISSDLFEFKGKTYLLISDQYSKFPVVRPLTGTTSAAIINHLKSIFSEYGIPSRLMTDNGPQYNCKEFKSFTATYGIDHVTSSPLYPQSNGFAERTVQTVENILKKCDEQGDDPYLGILSYRTTPVDSHLKSPAELLNGRKYKTTLPTAQRSFHTGTDRDHIRESLQQRKENQAKYYNQTARPQQPQLQDGQPVRMYDHKKGTWEPATVQQRAKEPRSYIVKRTDNDTVYRRTRSDLRPDPSAQGQDTTAKPPSDDQAQHKDTPSQYTTRYGRVVKPTTKLDL